MSATRRALIGSRGADFLSAREYGYHGMTAVIRLADASFAALTISSSSIRFRLTGLRARLHEEDVGAADRLAEADVQLAVRERLQLDLAEREAEMLADRVRQIRVRPPGEHHHPAYRIAIVVARHRAFLLLGVDAFREHELVSEEAGRANGFDHCRAPSSRRAATRSA